MKAPFQNLLHDFRAAIFAKDELELRQVTPLEWFLPLLPYHDSNSDVEIIFRTFKKEQYTSGPKQSIDTLMEKK